MTTPKALIQSFYYHLDHGDPQGAFALLHPAVEWREAEGNPLADRNPYRGAAEIAEGVLGRLVSTYDHFAATPEEFLAEGNRVIVFGRYTGTHKPTEQKLDCPFVHSWTVENGKIVQFQQYADTEQLARLK